MLAVEAPETRYVETPDGVFIAYQVVGDGPVDVAWQFDWLGNVDLVWDGPMYADLFEGIASSGRGARSRGLGSGPSPKLCTATCTPRSTSGRTPGSAGAPRRQTSRAR